MTPRSGRLEFELHSARPDDAFAWASLNRGMPTLYFRRPSGSSGILAASLQWPILLMGRAGPLGSIRPSSMDTLKHVL